MMYSWFFASLVGLCVAILCVDGFSFWVIVPLSFLLYRIYCLKERKIWQRVFLVAMAVLGISTYHRLQPAPTLLEGNVQTIVQLDPSSVSIDGDQWKGVIRELDTGRRWQAFYYLSSEEEKQSWEQAKLPRYMEVEGELKHPDRKRHLGGFDYQDYLNSQSIDQAITISHWKPYFEQNTNWDLLYIFSEWRMRIIHWVKNHQPPKLAEYTLALIFGETGALPNQVREAFKHLGILHFLSISGFHISYFIILLQHLFWRNNVSRETTDYLFCFLLPLFGFLLNWRISVFRAITQALFNILGRLRGKNFSGIDCWGLSLILAICLFPRQWQNLGFQLTYLLSAVLLISRQYLNDSAHHPLLSHFKLSLICLLFSLPVLAFHLFEFHPFSLFLNLFMSPIFSVILLPMLVLLLLLTLLSQSIPFLCLILDFGAWLLHFFDLLMISLGDYFGGSWVTGYWPLVVVCLFYFLAVQMLVRRERNQTNSIMMYVCMLSCVLLNHLSPIGIVAMIDVGQGDCFLIKEPFSTKAVMIDTGGKTQFGDREPWQVREKSYQLGRDTIVPALKFLGITEIDSLLITHADYDHCGELLSIATAMPINNIYVTQETLLDERLQKDLSLMAKSGVSVMRVTPYQFLAHNYFTLHLIAPVRTTGDANRDSLVVWTQFMNQKYLFMGDGDHESERILMTRYPQLRADILKVGHHGSRTSTSAEFLDFIQPHEAWVSAGEDNHYQHPHSDVIHSLEQRGIMIKRTDEHGSSYHFYLPSIWQKDEPFWYQETSVIEKE